MNTVKLLDKDNPKDLNDLKLILKHYVKDELEQNNPVYVAEYLEKFSQWILNRFQRCAKSNFVVAANYYDDELVQIMIGYTFDIAWGNDLALDTTPYWYVGLAYFKDKHWRNPGKEIIDLGLALGAHFERKGYYKFYTVKKMPNRIKTYEDLQKYINSPAYKTTFQVKRYHPKVEKIFRTTDDLTAFRFIHWSVILPRGITRPIMLIEYTLDPTIDLLAIMKQQ